MARDGEERRPLLGQHWSEYEDTRQLLKLSNYEKQDSRAWPRWRKLVNIFVIAMMSIISPLASSMFTPGISQIATDLRTTPTAVIGTTTSFVVFLGIGPLILAPLSETFGQRPLYLSCFTIFALLQIPTALAPNIESLIHVRSFAGFFGSVGIANGGGTISDMFIPEERAGVFGWYLLGPLLGLTLGPLFGGIIVQRLGWRWIFWILIVVCSINTLAGYFFLRETTNRDSDATNYRFEGEVTRSLKRKILTSLSRPPKMFTQPIVATIAMYQALLFATTYSIYTNMQNIYQGLYGFDTEKVGLLYLGLGLGKLLAVWFLVPRIDDIFASIVPAFLFGVGMVMILNRTQNYCIDSFETYAASAIAAGTVFRSLVGGVVPLFAPMLFERLGYGWGISVFAFVGVVLAPAPVLFYVFWGRIRETYAVELWMGWVEVGGMCIQI
ncbi:MFS general substrate transporter [Byssothecium circinans]|uniref:MFS general substrate transporter n=1 Tax=Byssothecium circinans TaxID=147558 RepID=A0A6A5TLV7_9PLEO|nr:MFS general substrate transporter [Byssothecium circinans]